MVYLIIRYYPRVRTYKKEKYHRAQTRKFRLTYIVCETGSCVLYCVTATSAIVVKYIG